MGLNCHVDLSTWVTKWVRYGNLKLQHVQSFNESKIALWKSTNHVTPSTPKIGNRSIGLSVSVMSISGTSDVARVCPTFHTKRKLPRGIDGLMCVIVLSLTFQHAHWGRRMQNWNELDWNRPYAILGSPFFRGMAFFTLFEQYRTGDMKKRLSYACWYESCMKNTNRSWCPNLRNTSCNAGMA